MALTEWCGDEPSVLTDPFLIIPTKVPHRLVPGLSVPPQVSQLTRAATQSNPHITTRERDDDHQAMPCPRPYAQLWAHGSMRPTSGQSLVCCRTRVRGTDSVGSLHFQLSYINRPQTTGSPDICQHGLKSRARY